MPVSKYAVYQDIGPLSLLAVVQNRYNGCAETYTLNGDRKDKKLVATAL
jgi:hypothetical protein